MVSTIATIASLVATGHLGKASTDDVALERAIEDFATFHGLSGTAEQRRAQAMRLLKRPRCALPDVLAARAAQCRWPMDEIRVALAYKAFGGFTKAQWHKLALEAVMSWQPHIGIKLRIVTPQESPHVLMTQKSIDAVGYTLGVAELPCGVDDGSVLGNWLDSNEPWRTRGEAAAVETLVHEFGHSLGLDHGSPESVMSPYLSGKFRRPQPEDVARIGPIYPGAKPEPAPPAPTELRLRVIHADVVATDAGGRPLRITFVP